MISIDKSLLYPPFATILIEFEHALTNAGLHFHLYDALRTWEMQDELYSKGRTSLGAIVTNAKGGDSWHNYGLAADYILDGNVTKPGIQWSWNTRADMNADGRNDWMQMGSIALNHGMEWGGNWKHFPDLPHVQKRYGLLLADAKELYRMGGMKRVWEECNSYLEENT